MSKKKHERQDPIALGLSFGGIDSHAHLLSRQFSEDLPMVLRRAKQAGVAAIGNVFLQPKAWEEQRQYIETVLGSAPDAYPSIFYILGVHPTEAFELDVASLDALRAACRTGKITAIGEIGLDYYWDKCPHDVQQKAFIAQLLLAKELELPVVIHARDSYDATLAILEEQVFCGYPLLWHCFGGNERLAARIIDAGWHISIPGPVGYPANEALRLAVASIPADKLLLETDCPYLSPAEYRGQRNEPAFVAFTAQHVAAARNVAPEVVWRQCGDNARRFFGLPE